MLIVSALVLYWNSFHWLIKSHFVDCGLPKPDNAHVKLLENKTTFGETAVISCWTGYTPKHSSNIMCLSNGTWEKWQECKITGKELSNKIINR